MRIGTMMMVAMLAGCAGVSIDQRNNKTTLAFVSDWAERVDRWKDDSGAYLHPEGEYFILDSADPWGNPSLSVTYAKSGFLNSLVVVSAGKDGIFGTPDDVKARKSTIDRSIFKSEIEVLRKKSEEEWYQKEKRN